MCPECRPALVKVLEGMTDDDKASLVIYLIRGYMGGSMVRMLMEDSAQNVEETGIKEFKRKIRDKDDETFKEMIKVQIETDPSTTEEEAIQSIIDTTVDSYRGYKMLRKMVEASLEFHANRKEERRNRLRRN